jgi:hypothetical protein
MKIFPVETWKDNTKLKFRLRYVHQFYAVSKSNFLHIK